MDDWHLLNGSNFNKLGTAHKEKKINVKNDIERINSVKTIIMASLWWCILPNVKRDTNLKVFELKSGYLKPNTLKLQK
jgi:hypothetical protein